MKKTLLIIQREYLSRVKRRMFLITTLLVPLLISGLISMVVYLTAKNEEKQTIVIQDESGYFVHKLDSTSEAYTMMYAKPNLNESKADFLERMKGDILVKIFPFQENKLDSIILYNEGGVSFSAKMFIEDEINDLYIIKQMEDAGINKSQIDSINNTSINIKSYDLENNKETSSEIAMAIGYLMGFVMYMIMFIYGTGVMRGVMEEKTNRIAEVMVSSVKPFQLMMGKIIGIGLVGLTQFAIWGLLLTVLKVILPMVFGLDVNTLPSGPMSDPEVKAEAMKVMADNSDSIFAMIQSQNWLLIVGCFVVYFLGGYFMYAALFAAVGSMVNEDPQEAQQISFPVTLPIVFGIIIMISAIKEPNGSLSVFGSLFPLTSPIVMMARIPYGVPAWQILLSIALLIIGFIFLTWLSAKIYRTGILMYGKKASWKEAWKWLRS